jgi:hypothetical protein
MKNITRILLLCAAFLAGSGAASYAQLKTSRAEPAVWTLGVIGGMVDSWQSGSYHWGQTAFENGSGVDGSLALTAEMRLSSGSTPELGIELQAGWKEEMAKGMTTTVDTVLIPNPSMHDSISIPIRYVNDGALWVSSAMIAPSLTMHVGSMFVLGVGAQVLFPIRVRTTRLKTLVDSVVTIPELGEAQLLIAGEDPNSLSFPDRVRDDARVSASAMVHLGATIPLFSHLSLVPRLALTVPLTRLLADDDVKLMTAEALLGMQWSL